MCWFLQSRPSVLVCRNNISIHQMCWFLLSTIAAVRFVSHFNTSNVLVSLRPASFAAARRRISIHQMCWFLFINLLNTVKIVPISIHQMCWFLNHTVGIDTIYVEFQYIKCVGFSRRTNHLYKFDA